MSPQPQPAFSAQQISAIRWDNLTPAARQVLQVTATAWFSAEAVSTTGDSQNSDSSGAVSWQAQLVKCRQWLRAHKSMLHYPKSLIS
ncbi:hypothetical protein [Beggiatoa leptomitoformis]|uniref:Uncharacterized protein n=1 Tax=Beggiatoa leptomitoformis TaxID=288004 RepID=A0A2N9YAR1_9GAMM|nr:hypothetical protein [Beggiatoa leptomitoformis]ALG67077.1 hypothetical protein AL038_04305 [Beggiatoa leptomitoformis]AUI67532.1 hypothetical protein BLE401_01700 [Beggiatoa leptomitoformis]